MKKFFVLTLLFMLGILFTSFESLPAFADNTELRVISNKSIIYLSIDCDNELLFDISDDESTLEESDPKHNDVNNFAFIVYHNNILISDGELIEKTITVNSATQKFTFYKIDVALYNQKYGTTYGQTQPTFTYGYILSTAVMPNKNSSLKTYLDTNATLKQNDNILTYKYSYTSNKFEETGSLPAGKKIKLIDGYNKNNKYTKIQYQTDDLFIETCYVETEMIAVSNISVGAICAIMISVACVSIILILLGIINKFKKFKKIKQKLAEKQ